MHGQFLLECREGTVERVGGVGDVELGILLICKEVGEVRCKRSIRTANVLVGEVPSRLSVLKSGDGLLANERFPTHVPSSERCREGCFVGCRERMDERQKLLARVGLRAACEISPHNLDLVELADLYRNALKHLEETSPSVDHDRFEHPAALFKNGTCVSVVSHEFAPDLMPPEVLREWPGAEDTDAIPAAPEGRVGDDDRWVRCNLGCR